MEKAEPQVVLKRECGRNTGPMFTISKCWSISEVTLEAEAVQWELGSGEAAKGEEVSSMRSPLPPEVWGLII